VPPRLHAATGSRLLVVQGTRLQLLDVDSGRRTTIRTVPHPEQYDRLDAVVVGSELVLVGDNNTGAGTGPFPVYATTAGPGSSLRTIGDASFLMSSERSGRVWLRTWYDDNERHTDALTEVDLRGRVHRQPPFEAQPFGSHYLRGTGVDDRDTELVDAAGRRLHLYKGRHLGLVSRGTAFLEPQTPCGPCRLTIVRSGTPQTERGVTVEEMPSLFDAQISPDGSKLLSGIHDENAGLPYSRITELDLKTGRSRDVSDALSASYVGASFQFSRDGRWLFFIDADTKSVDAYDLKRRRSFRVPGRFDTITQLVVL
jgi:hypothetical protein